MVEFLNLASSIREEEEEELLTRFFDFDPVEEWLVDLHPAAMMSVEPSDQGGEVVGSPIDAKMEKVRLVEQEEIIRSEGLIEEKIDSTQKDGGGGGEEKNGSTEIIGAVLVANGDGGCCDGKRNDLIGEEKNDSTVVESEEEDDSDEEEDSSDESSSSSSSSSEEEEAEAEEEGEIMDSETEETVFVSDDKEDGSNSKGPAKPKYDMEVLPPVPPVEVSLESHHQTMPVGEISSILGSRVIVEGSEKHCALNEGSILWITESRTPLGIVDEIFGPVKCPYYVIRYNSDDEVPTGINVGASVSFVPEFAQHILNQKELQKKGYDASGDNDDEISDEVEFSDDEKEAEYKRSLQQQKRGTSHVDHDSGPGKRTSIKENRFQKNNRLPNFTPTLPAADTSQQHQSQAEQLQAQSTSIGKNSGKFAQGVATVGPRVAPSTMMMQTIPPQPQSGAGTGFFDPFQQHNAVWANRLQPQHPSLGMQGGGYPMNPLQLQIGQHAYNLQYQMQVNQAFGGLVNPLAGGMMPYMQQQFVPNHGAPNGNIPFFGGLVNPLAGFPPTPVQPMGQGGFGQVPFERNNVNPQGASGSFTEQNQGQSSPSVGHGEMSSPPMQSNRGRSTFRGRRPHQRGRHSYGGRGRGQQKNG